MDLKAIRSNRDNTSVYRTIAFLSLVRYIFKTQRLDIQNLGVPQLHGKRYMRLIYSSPANGSTSWFTLPVQ